MERYSKRTRKNKALTCYEDTHTSTLPTFEKGVPQADNAHSLITALQIKTPRARAYALAHPPTLTHYSLSPWYNRKQWNKGPLFLPSDCHLPAIAVHSLEDGTEKTNKRVSAREVQEKGG